MPEQNYYPGMGEGVAARTYNRPGEKWRDVATRVSKGNAYIVLPGQENYPADWEYHYEYTNLRRHMINATIIMSGRHLQHGDENQRHRHMEVFTNCSTAPATFVLLYLLLNGSGVGRNYDNEMILADWGKMPPVHLYVDKDHPDVLSGEIKFVNKIKNKEYKVVGDSREGWAYVLADIETAIHNGDMTPLYFDFSKVRCRGTPINGMQERPASGPGPLMQAIKNVKSLKGKGYAPWLNAMFADHFLAECVVVGGVRRSARMATKSWDNEGIEDFITCKRILEPMMWSSNNSVLVDTKFWEEKKTPGSHAEKIFNLVTKHSYFDGTGEPGFINRHLLDQGKKVTDRDPARRIGGQRFPLSGKVAQYTRNIELVSVQQPNQKIVNPCSEIVLDQYGGFCVIGDVAPYFADSLEDATDAFAAVTRSLIRVNLMPSLYDDEVRRTNRIGVGLTGLHEFAWKFFGLGFRDLLDWEKSRKFWKTMLRFKKHVTDTAHSYARKLKVNTPETDTTIKPSGSVSKLFGITEGVHLPAMREYLRWVQYSKADPQIDQYVKAGYPTRELSQMYKGVVIVGFPTRPLICTLGMGDKLVTAAEATPEEQYQFLQLLERFWIDGDGIGRGNQISYTLKYDPKKVDYEQFCTMLEKYQPSIRCCSVMPSGDTTAYEYQPEQPITADEYDALMSAIRPLGEKEGVGVEHLGCGTGACPIDFKG